MQSARPFLIIGLVLVAAALSVYLLLRPRQLNHSVAAIPPGAPGSPVNSSQPQGAVVTLEEFGDYQCPPCGALHPSLKKLKQEFGPNLNFVFRNLPLTGIHKNALAAAQAAEAARMQNHFWEMHDWLYENQSLWAADINPRTIFLKSATDLGLDAARFSRDLDDQQVKLRIEADGAAATELGVNGTPTVLLNGRILRPDVTTEQGIRKGIEYLISRNGSATSGEPQP
jgi:protein-disulfide isomerase